jgi:hypothetical protein
MAQQPAVPAEDTLSAMLRPFSLPLFTGVRGREILGSLHTVSCIENGASKPQGSLLSESTPGDRLIHVVVLNRYAGS